MYIHYLHITIYMKNGSMQIAMYIKIGANKSIEKSQSH